MPADPSFHMTIEDVFSIRGRGTVVTGQIDSGTLKVGDEIQLQRQGFTRKTTVTAIDGLQKLLQQAQTGDNVGVLLNGINKGDVKPGDVLAGIDSNFNWKS